MAFSKDSRRAKIRTRIRARVKGTDVKPRLSVFRSNKQIYAQIIDDSTSRTLVAASTLDKEIRKPAKSNCNIEFAVKVGKLLADRAEEKSIKLVAFDKGGHKYHGVVKALADEARKKLQF